MRRRLRPPDHALVGDRDNGCCEVFGGGPSPYGGCWCWGTGGHEYDSDLDGVPDHLDQCMGWDDLADFDGDGLPDGCDSTPPGTGTATGTASGTGTGTGTATGTGGATGGPAGTADDDSKGCSLGSGTSPLGGWVGLALLLPFLRRPR